MFSVNYNVKVSWRYILEKVVATVHNINYFSIYFSAKNGLPVLLTKEVQVVLYKPQQYCNILNEKQLSGCSLYTLTILQYLTWKANIVEWHEKTAIRRDNKMTPALQHEFQWPSSLTFFEAGIFPLLRRCPHILEFHHSHFWAECDVYLTAAFVYKLYKYIFHMLIAL